METLNLTLDIKIPDGYMGLVVTDFDPRIASQTSNLNAIINNAIKYPDYILKYYVQEHNRLLVETDYYYGFITREEWFEYCYAMMVKSYNQMHNPSCPDKHYWEQVYTCWTLNKIEQLPIDIYKDLFFAGRQKRFKYLFQPEEKEAYDALPDKITVYRGCQQGYEDGWSYTTSYDVAKWFAVRHAGKLTMPRIVHATMRKKDVVAMFDVKQEREILATKWDITKVEELAHIPNYKGPCPKA